MRTNAGGPVISRLVSYLRILERLGAAGLKQTSSRQLAKEAQVSAYQVRKDLTRFGRTYGSRGTGYEVSTLERELRDILGLSGYWDVAIVGVGRLGGALAHYPNFDRYHFHLKALFDVDPEKVGSEIAGMRVASMEELPELIPKLQIDIALIAVPLSEAQQVADALVEAGVKGILNFAPTPVRVKEGIHVEPVDFLAGLTRLSFYIHETQVKGEPQPGDRAQAEEEPA